MWYIANVLLICLAPHPLLILPSHTRHWCLLHGMLWSCLMPRAHTLDWSPQMLITETGMSWDNSTLNLFWPSTICGIYPHTLANTHTHARACFFSLSRICDAGAGLRLISPLKPSTYISVMFSMSDSGTKTGKSSIPGSWSIHEILEALQKHEPGQAELSLSSPNKSPHSPKWAIPRTAAIMAGLARCVQRRVMFCSIFSNSEMRRRYCGMRKDVVRDARQSWSGLIWSP